MKPSDLGFPPKFGKWRNVQYDAIVAAACSDTRFTMVNAPPGVGKSGIVLGLSRFLDARTLVLTQTKGLQTQYMREFEGMGLKEIKGQNNYNCLYYDNQDYQEYGYRRKRTPRCDEGPCHAGVACDLRERGCYYYDAVRTAARARLVVANYAYWMSIQRYSEPQALGHFDLLVLDEAHDAAESLSEFVRIHLSREDVHRYLGIDLLHEATIEEWVEWAGESALPVCRRLLEAARTGTELHLAGVAGVRKIKDLESRLVDLTRAREWRRHDAPDPPAWVPGATTDWVIEEDASGITFQPVWANGYAEAYLFANIKRVLLTSATVTKKDAAYLGISQDKLTYHAYPSPFKTERRPLYYIPTTSVSRDMTAGQRRQLINRIDQLIEREKGNKGIIHSVSYHLARFIYENSRHRNKMFIHDRKNTRAVVERFKAASGGILVSPSVSTGWDFPYDECRFQIIAKLPFLDSRPAVIRARHHSDKWYLNYATLVILIQMVGRGMRAEDDWCRTYLIDDNWRWFGARTKAMQPKWFRSAVRRIESMSALPAAS